MNKALTAAIISVEQLATIGTGYWSSAISEDKIEQVLATTFANPNAVVANIVGIS